MDTLTRQLVKPRLPANGWQRRQTTDTPAFFIKVENDVDTDQVVTEAEVQAFYKRYGQLLRGVKQRTQVEIVAASKTAGENYVFTGLDANKLPIFAPVPVFAETPTDELVNASGAAAADFAPSTR